MLGALLDLVRLAASGYRQCILRAAFLAVSDSGHARRAPPHPDCPARRQTSLRTRGARFLEHEYPSPTAPSAGLASADLCGSVRTGAESGQRTSRGRVLQGAERMQLHRQNGCRLKHVSPTRGAQNATMCLGTPGTPKPTAPWARDRFLDRFEIAAEPVWPPLRGLADSVLET